MIIPDDTIHVADYQQHEALLIGSAKDVTIHTRIERVIAEGITMIGWATSTPRRQAAAS